MFGVLPAHLPVWFEHFGIRSTVELCSLCVLSLHRVVGSVRQVNSYTIMDSVVIFDRQSRDDVFLIRNLHFNWTINFADIRSRLSSKIAGFDTKLTDG